MKQYRQLTEDDRIEIYAMKQAGKTPAYSAFRLGVDRSTIYRELKRNSGRRGYRPKQAHQKAIQRRCDARKAVKMRYQVAELVFQEPVILVTRAGQGRYDTFYFLIHFGHLTPGFDQLV